MAPGLLMVTTSFIRLIVVFSFLRQAMGTQQMPPNQVMVSLALILTFFIMEPVGKNAYENAVKPYIDKKISYEEEFEKGAEPFK
jgi:flagellar biosynthetic protein FliP